MLISTRGRYALYVLIDLAHHENEGYVPLKEIAERQHISKKYMEGILKILVEHDLLEGVKGKGGGYRLTKPTTDYTLGEILRLTEGDLASVSCTSSSTGPCKILPPVPHIRSGRSWIRSSMTIWMGSHLLNSCKQNTPGSEMIPGICVVL